MQLIQNALAALAAAKARLLDLVEPEKVIAERVEACIHAFAQDFERLHEQVQGLIARVEGKSAPSAATNAGASAEAPASTTAAEASSPAEAQADAPVPATPS